MIYLSGKAKCVVLNNHLDKVWNGETKTGLLLCEWKAGLSGRYTNTKRFLAKFSKFAKLPIQILIV